MIKRAGFLAGGFLVALLLMVGCSEEVSSIVGPSSSGFSLNIKAFYGAGGLPSDGTSKATIRVEVIDETGRGASTTVTLTTTRGTLETESLTVTNGVGVTTLTSVSTPGTAYIVATVENITATTIVPMVNITGSAS